MAKEELDLQNALINTYSRNLEVLNILDNELFQRISLLSDAINSETYKERYFLEFLKEVGEFDIYDSHEKKYLYDKKPDKWNKKAINDTILDSSNSFNLFNEALYKVDISNLNSRETNLYRISDNKVIENINPFKKVLESTDLNKIKKVKKIEKFVFIGTLLSRHIIGIVNKLNLKNIFICESNLEVFRLSLFVFDYSFLAMQGRSVKFSVMEDETQFVNKFNSFFSIDSTKTTFLKYYTSDYNVKQYFEFIPNSIFKFDAYKFNYQAVLDSIIKRTTKNFNKYNLLKFTKNNEGLDYFNKPVLLLGAGPSLGDNINWLIKNQDRFVIVALAATLNKLIPNNIIPDVITSYDPQDIVVNQFLGEATLDKIKDKIKVIAINTDQSVLNIFNNDENLFTYETHKSFQKNSYPVNGASVGEATLKILLSLSIKDIYILGLDLALHKDTGKSHIDTHMSHDSGSLEQTSSIEKGQYSLREDYIKIKGNFDEEVTSTRLFYLSIIEMNNIIIEFKSKDTNIYNLSSNGAYIQNTEALKIEDINIKKFNVLDKMEINNYLKKYLLDISNVPLNKEIISSEIKVLDEVYKDLKVFSSSNITKYEDFEKYLDFVFTKLNQQTIFLEELTINYMFIINRYITHCFNLKDLKQEKSKIKKVKSIWVNQYLELLEDYKKCLLTL